MQPVYGQKVVGQTNFLTGQNLDLAQRSLSRLALFAYDRQRKIISSMVKKTGLIHPTEKHGKDCIHTHGQTRPQCQHIQSLMNITNSSHCCGL